ncbi:hypothetical protein [Brevibacillus centrosporus]|uniref:hypothetical protein n=1 Tax=Brevibacillus centrosporus TaxID=54910 RepID=UPI003B01ABA5
MGAFGLFQNVSGLPTKKLNSDKTLGGKWSFWKNLLKVKAGDIIVHLRGEGAKAFFVGMSVAETDGYETKDRPPQPGKWGYSDTFYRVLLKDYESLPNPMKLHDLFKSKEVILKAYFNNNRLKTTGKKSLFYVIQSGRLQCQNGAYLSEIDDELFKIIFEQNPPIISSPSEDKSSVKTGESFSLVSIRKGQSEFSEKVKENFHYICCFPDCEVNEKKLLIGAHIARWADVPTLRGEITNGLSFCLIHDKLFETGCFTLDKELRIRTNKAHVHYSSSQWCNSFVKPFEGVVIKNSKIAPSEEAIQHHWIRIGYKP